jgi:hypothetical protein
MWSKSRKLPLDVAEQVADSQYQNDKQNKLLILNIKMTM